MIQGPIADDGGQCEDTQSRATDIPNIANAAANDMLDEAIRTWVKAIAISIEWLRPSTGTETVLRKTTVDWICIHNCLSDDGWQCLGGDAQAPIFKEEGSVSDACYRDKPLQDEVLELVDQNVRHGAVGIPDKQDLRVAFYKMVAAVELICWACGNHLWQQRRRTNLRGRVHLEDQRAIITRKLHQI